MLDKPRGDASDDDWERNFRFTVKVVARVKVITHPRLRLAAQRAHGTATTAPASAAKDHFRGGAQLVAIGASTGGPGALVELLRGLNGKLKVPALLVIHISELFGASFADWLDGQSALPVRYVVDGEPLPPRGVGQILMAPPDRHLIVRARPLEADARSRAPLLSPVGRRALRVAGARARRARDGLPA